MIYTSYPKAGYLKYKEEINSSIQDALESGIYVKGKNVSDFENLFSEYIKVRYAIGVGNATDAIFLSLLSLGIGFGDEVITVSLTATGTVAAIVNTGATPVFIDVNENFFTINTKNIETKINEKTKAILVVHLYGQPCDMREILKISKKYNLFLIEDCAQASGSEYNGEKVGSLGTLGCFSFFPTKNLSCIGDGGLVTTNNEKLFSRIKSLAQYGWDENRNAKLKGINSRLDELQAAILKVKLKYLDQDNNERRRIAEIYKSKITNPKIIHPKEADYSYHIYHLYVVKIMGDRDKLIKYLNKNQIFPGIHYPLPVHSQEYFKKFVKNADLETTNSLSKNIISLPIYQGMETKHVNKIINILNNF